MLCSVGLLLEEEGERERIYKMAVAEIKLRRTETSQPWGFRLKGGVDQGLPLHVESVSIEDIIYHSLSSICNHSNAVSKVSQLLHLIYLMP